MANKSCNKHKKFNYYCQDCQRINEMYSAPAYYFKISLIGKKGVGKSTLAKFSGFDTFNNDTRLTTGIDYISYDYLLKASDKNEFAKLSIWAYNPESRFKEMFNRYLLGSNAVLIMFDVSDLNSLKEIDNWMGVIRKQCHEIPVVLIGNKADLIEHVERAKVLADSIVKKYHLEGYYEISALESRNIEPAFAIVADTVLKRLNPNLVKRL